MNVFIYLIRLIENKHIELEHTELKSASKIGIEQDKCTSHTSMVSLTPNAFHDNHDTIYDGDDGHHENTTNQFSDKFLITKVTSKALPGVIEAIDRIAFWIMHMIQRSYDLNLFPSELVCDFIKDEDEKFVFLQVKGFKLNDISLATAKLWGKLMSSFHERNDRDETGLLGSETMKPKELWNEKYGRKKLSINELTEKLREEVMCICMLLFVCCYCYF